MQVRIQGCGTSDDREGESGGEVGEDSQSLTNGICLFGRRMGLMSSCMAALVMGLLMALMVVVVG